MKGRRVYMTRTFNFLRGVFVDHFSQLAAQDLRRKLVLTLRRTSRQIQRLTEVRAERTLLQGDNYLRFYFTVHYMKRNCI